MAAPDWLWAVLPVAGIVALIFVPTVAVALWEKRLVWPYALPEDEVSSDDAFSTDEDNPYAASRAVEKTEDMAMTDHAARATDQAGELGFEPLGTFRDGKGRMYRIRYDMWISPGRETLAVVGGGTLATVPVRNTWLHTLLPDGRCLTTVEDEAACAYDLSGLIDEALMPGRDFTSLLDRHQGRLATAPLPLRFSETDPLKEYRAFSTRRVERLVEKGLARFLDPGQTRWRYTLKGALLFSAFGVMKGIRRRLLPDGLIRRLRSSQGRRVT